MTASSGRELVNSPAAWLRLACCVLLGTIGGVGMWSVVVVLPTVEAEFGLARAGASLPYSLAMIGFGAGGVLMGRLADRFGIVVPTLLGAVLLSLGYFVSSLAANAWQFTIAFGLLVGLGSSATFSPLMADISHWFDRRRGIAVAISASGNYLAGTIWPPLVQHFTEFGRMAPDPSRHRPLLHRDDDAAGASRCGAPRRRQENRARAQSPRACATQPGFLPVP